MPAETLAFFVPLAAAIGTSNKTLLAIVLVAGLIGSVAWLIVNAAQLPNDQKPRFYFYFLAGVAYLCWAIGTSPNVSALIGVSSLTASVALGVGVFLIPLIDTALSLKNSDSLRNPG